MHPSYGYAIHCAKTSRLGKVIFLPRQLGTLLQPGQLAITVILSLISWQQMTVQDIMP